MVVSIDNRIAGILAVSDEPKAEAKRAIEILIGMGITPVMLTRR